ncbi:FliI/YscN family ATPase [Buchnera aphidicola (Ceratovacuna keduensis)]|uniref:FliI/YscN family ATPase n=1 Tax=Buchnera aphidicola TaxID=9 RepID=UPI0031B8A708
MNQNLKNWLKNINLLYNKMHKFPIATKYGYVISFVGLLIEVSGISLSVGEICIIEVIYNKKKFFVEAEVTGFKNRNIFVMLFEDSKGISPGLRVFQKIDKNGNNIGKMLPVGKKLLGRVVDSYGNSIDNLKNLNCNNFISTSYKKINPLKKKPINQILDTGIRAINSSLTIGRGQRIGLFASSGVGKSVLLSMISKNSKSDVFVIGLIGERSREILEFVENIKSANNFSKSVVIVAPANNSPLLKVQGALYAISVAEYFRKKGNHVLFILDSLTRYAMAEREISISMGEIPVMRGYPTSIFSKLPFFIERSGNNENDNCSITGLYTVLIENNKNLDPISDLAKSILDGHIMLSKSYSNSGHYPAINMETSISRVMSNLVGKDHYNKAIYLKKLISIYRKNKDLISLGAYVKGNDKVLDTAIKLWPKIEKFLKQDKDIICNFNESYKKLNELIK